MEREWFISELKQDLSWKRWFLSLTRGNCCITLAVGSISAEDKQLKQSQNETLADINVAVCLGLLGD